MNKIAIATQIQINDKILLIGFCRQWPTSRTLKAMARLKLARLKRKINDAAFRVAMAVIPMPQYAAA